MSLRKWTRPAEPELLTPAQFLALPAQIDGTVVRIVADAANGVLWKLRFNSGSASTYKWEWESGSALWAAVATTAAIASAAGGWSDLTSSPGPTILPPLAGEYDVDGGCVGAWTTSANAYHGLSVLSNAANYFLSQYTETSSAVFGGNNPLVGSARLTATIATGMKMQYANLGGVNSATPSFTQRWLKAQPVRVLGP
jgi:hypothetical protein